MQRISIMLAATALGLSLSAAPAFAVDYIVGEPYCTPEAVNFIEERDGNRYHWCLAKKPAPFQQGIYSADATSTGAAGMPAIAVPTPGPVDPDPADPDPSDPDPVEPGDCLKVSDCPNEPAPKPDPAPESCESKIDCVGPAPVPEPTGPRLCNAKGECRP